MALAQTSANSFGLAPIGVNRLVRLLGNWRQDDASLHAQLSDRLRTLAVTGAMPSGIRLPSERALGTALGLGRNTVTKALDTLREEGLLSSRQGDGTYVTYSRRYALNRSDDRMRTFVDEAHSATIDLRSAALPGLPMVAEAFNHLDGARARELVAQHGYIPTGLPELRQAIASYYTALGLPTAPDEILVTSGAQSAFRLVASFLLGPQSTVLIEEPSFRGAIETLNALGVRLVGIRSGPEGVAVDDLAKAVSSLAPRMVLLQSTVHNPTGSVLDSLRRSRVAAIAARSGVVFVDDASLADTIIDGERRPIPLAAGAGTIVTVGSMSKSFWGGLRVGWVRARPDMVAELAAVKGGEDLGTSVIAQLVSAELLPLIERARDQRLMTLSENRRLAIEALDELLPDWAPQMPAGGSSLWIRLPQSSATSLVQRAERLGVRLLPGSTFSVTDRLDDHVRLAFAGPPDVTRRGIELLATAWDELDR